MADKFDLQRFKDAQVRDYDTALAELRSGRKRTHWIWYVFPQIDGLGRSSTARRYAISGIAEAKIIEIKNEHIYNEASRSVQNMAGCRGCFGISSKGQRKSCKDCSAKR